MSAPWQCPACTAWIAPHVSEHRCDPPAASVKVTSIEPPGTGGTFTSVSPPPGTITVNLTSSTVSQRDLTTAIQDGLLRTANRNRGGGWHLSGRAA